MAGEPLGPPPLELELDTTVRGSLHPPERHEALSAGVRTQSPVILYVPSRNRGRPRIAADNAALHARDATATA